ncbi:MAG: metalloprotease PmbA [Gammaproteobacteria bacterium]|nr:metalloprotease PmbA [Gammaproteobacteria bacterium]
MQDSLIPEQSALDVALLAATIARRAGCAAAVSVNAGNGLSVGVRNGEVETLEYHRDKSLAVTVYRSGRKGSATTSDFAPASVTETVDAAQRIAQDAEADACAGLIDPQYLAREIPDLDLDHPWDIEPEAAIALALECEAAARSAEKEVRQVDEAAVHRYRGLHAYADTQGFAGAWRATRHSLSCTAVGSRDGAMQRGYWYTIARRAADLDAAAEVGRTAAARTVARLGARKLKTGKWPVVFENRLATGLVGHLVAAVSGANLYREASFLRDALGTRVLPDFVTIDERPHLPRGLGSAPFDGEGMATRDRLLVERGVLAGYVLDGYAARRLGLVPTGHAGGVHNLVVSDQGEDLDALLKRMQRGLFVTELMGFGVNLVTGDYSRGASGFWIEDGAIVHPVEEITIAGNLREMFANLVATGCDLECRGTIRCGSILLPEMTIAGD